MTIGVLLINLGTPTVATKTAVRAYLREFLNDARVIDLPYLARKVLVNFLIIPLRTTKATNAYQQIWQQSGSPLLTYGQQLRHELAIKLGANYKVALGMRYATPTIASAYQELQQCQQLIVVPLFPQYASAATGAAIETFLKIVLQQITIPHMTIVNKFYDEPGFINCHVYTIQQALVKMQADALLLSYHGLPERHLTSSGCVADCDRVTTCPAISALNATCYRAQCYATSALIEKALQLPKLVCYTAFQSRLGKTPWIKPYTDELLKHLRCQGVKNLMIACPSFVADCLETLEEIGIRARAAWQALGGEQFMLLPALNANADWVDSLAGIVLKNSFGERY